MSVLIDADAIEARRAAGAGPLAPLATSLAADLARAIDRPLYVPEDKALLSREGGWCPRDGTMLEFDPFTPQAHRCPACGQTFGGELHHRFWIYWYQLWLAERAVHGALLSRLGVEPRGAALATSILDAYADRYLTYPNADNALGPTRPFFSTYLESIWLLNLCVAADLLDPAAGPTVDRFRERVVAPSLALISGFDEGLSNRQVWNNAAIMAANLCLGRPDAAEAVAWDESGLAVHLTEALLPDGTWYEGENYHLFAHRGLWYSVTMAERLGVELPPQLVDRFEAGFGAPFLTALPDFTLPSRRDSQYAISLRQWRFAEMCELGEARRHSPALVGALARLYDGAAPAGDSGRWRSSADVERNRPAVALRRADLGWRSLLFATPVLPEGRSTAPASVLLESQGIGVMRRDAGRVYVALDYGHTGGGHGHPDRLNLLLSRGATRWLDDMGTGSYVDPTLHWYRSTLAHNAPLFDGRSQVRAPGELVAFEDRGGAGWISAVAPVTQGSAVVRSVVAMSDYLVDTIEWEAPAARFLDLPFHMNVRPTAATSDKPAVLIGGSGAEDGFRFLREARRIATAGPSEVLSFTAEREGATCRWWVAADQPLEVWTAMAPGPPGGGDAPFALVRVAAAAATIRSVIAWGDDVDRAVLFPEIVVHAAGARHHHAPVTHGWNVVIEVDGAKSTIDLGCQRASVGGERALEEPVEPDERRAIVLREGRPIRVSLGEASYRRSEQTWLEAGKPSADVSIGVRAGAVAIDVAVRNVDPSFAAVDAINRLDNERADVNGAGIQLYAHTASARTGCMLVPVAGRSDVTVREIDGWGLTLPVRATWMPTAGGYDVHVELQPAGLGDDRVVDLDLIVNEKPAGRERRRGQLVLSGGDGFVYLRGDRHDPGRLVPFVVAND